MVYSKHSLISKAPRWPINEDGSSNDILFWQKSPYVTCNYLMNSKSKTKNDMGMSDFRDWKGFANPNEYKEEQHKLNCAEFWSFLTIQAVIAVIAQAKDISRRNSHGTKFICSILCSERLILFFTIDVQLSTSNFHFVALWLMQEKNCDQKWIIFGQWIIGKC